MYLIFLSENWEWKGKVRAIDAGIAFGAYEFKTGLSIFWFSWQWKTELGSEKYLRVIPLLEVNNGDGLSLLLFVSGFPRHICGLFWKDSKQDVSAYDFF